MLRPATPLLLLTLLGALPSPGADPATECARHLKAIGQALRAYQQGQGRLPGHLSDLYPRYLPAKSLLRCPADITPAAKSPAPRLAVERFPVSYAYEMSPQLTAVRCVLLGPRPLAMTWRAQKLAQQMNFGDRVPVVRCGRHGGAGDRPEGEMLNLTLAGEIYRSQKQWEYEPETVCAVLACMERDLDAGAPAFGRRWQSAKLARYLEGNRPAPVCRERCRSVAAKLAALAWNSPILAGSQLSAAAQSLFRAAGDDHKANEWRRQWTRRWLAPIASVS